MGQTFISLIDAEQSVTRPEAINQTNRVFVQVSRRSFVQGTPPVNQESYLENKLKSGGYGDLGTWIRRVLPHRFRAYSNVYTTS